MPQNLLNLGRYVLQLLDDALTLLGLNGTLGLSDAQSKQQKCLNLGCKCLGRCNTDLRAGMSVTAGIGRTCY